MARPISWLPRLAVIRESVGSSVRSHYDSTDLQRLFEVQPRSAQMILSLLPTQRVGKSLLVERSALAALLDRVAGANDPAEEWACIKAKGKPPAVRRKLRVLVQQDVNAEATDLGPNVKLEQGFLSVNFKTIEELATSMYRVAMLLQEDMEGFAFLL